MTADRRRERRVFSDEVVGIAATRARMLGDPTRVRLLLALTEHDATVQQLTDRFSSASHQSVSRQLNLLYRAGMVNRRKDGREMHYALVDYVSLWVIEQLANSAEDRIAQLHELFSSSE
jgi:DNA-binding transcriptional ArsR family regulator